MSNALQTILLAGLAISGLAITGIASADPVSTALTNRPLVFETTFSPVGEPGMLRYHAMFKAHGADHQLEVWRDGDRRVKRVTDRALVTYAVHKRGEVNFELQMLDLSKRISTHIDRTTMYRLGNFTDWFDLTHGLRQPKGSYRLTRTAVPPTTVKPLEACDWYTLQQNSQATRLCWSRADRLPLLILAADGSPAWQVVVIDRSAIPPGTFVVGDKGFIQVDAVKDSEQD